MAQPHVLIITRSSRVTGSIREEKNVSALRKIIDDAMQQGVQLQSLEAPVTTAPVAALLTILCVVVYHCYPRQSHAITIMNHP